MLNYHLGWAARSPKTCTICNITQRRKEAHQLVKYNYNKSYRDIYWKITHSFTIISSSIRRILITVPIICLIMPVVGWIWKVSRCLLPRLWALTSSLSLIRFHIIRACFLGFRCWFSYMNKELFLQIIYLSWIKVVNYSST